MAAALQSAVVPAQAPDSPAQLSALLHGAAVAPLDNQAFLRVAGSDATRWLNGMVTNSIQDLAPGQGCYNFVLNAQGRIQGDCTIYREPDGKEPAFVLATDASQIDTVRQHLEKFIIMDDVELTPMDHYRQGVLLLGPKSVDILRRIEVPLLTYETSLAHLGPMQIGYYDLTAEQVTTPGPGLGPRFAISTSVSEMARRMIEKSIAAGAIPVSPEALEQLRILEGTPRYGADIRDKDLPQETGQTRALHFTKGCYLGQEIVERIRSRGNVHRTFTGFTLAGTLPPAGAVLQAEGKPAGELTSVAAIPLPESAARTGSGPLQLALGYVRREALDRNLTLEYPGGIATPIALPYPIP